MGIEMSAAATSLQQSFHQAHLARLARIEGRSYRPAPVTIPEPEPVEPAPAEEIEPRALWFRIVGSGIPLIRDVQEVVADFYGFSIVDLHSKRRDFPLARVRQVAMYLAKTLTEKSMPEIGRRFGGRDHTTVLHAVRKIGNLIQTDRELADEIAELKSRLETL